MQNKYIYNGKEISKEDFYTLTEDTYKWFENNSLKAIDFGTLSDFFDGKYKSKEEIDNKIKEIEVHEPEEVKSYIKHYPERLYWQRRTENKVKTGQKFNSYKLPMSKLFVQFPDALQAVILASCYGNFKYPEDTDWLNFKRVYGGSQTYKDASIRHCLAGEKDNESDLPEIFHQTWNKLAELQLWIEENNINIKEFSKTYLENLHNSK